MTKTETIVNGLNEFAANNNNKFTVNMAAEHFGASADTIRKAFRQIDGLQPQREGSTMFWSLITAGKRVIKTSPEARNHKILRYFRSACYNAAKLELSQEEMLRRLMGWMDEYEIHQKGTLLKVAAGAGDKPSGAL